jgi:hypothetical protein
MRFGSNRFNLRDIGPYLRYILLYRSPHAKGRHEGSMASTGYREIRLHHGSRRQWLQARATNHKRGPRERNWCCAHYRTTINNQKKRLNALALTHLSCTLL